MDAQIINTARAHIDSKNQRSAWNKGVDKYAHELLDGLEELIDGGYFLPDDLSAPALVEKAMLNGADNWNHYSWSGCSLCYDCQIAERLCTPSELKRKKGGDLRPNSREEWLDTQARALTQAANRAKRAIKYAIENSEIIDICTEAYKTLPNDEIDHHESDLYLKVTSKSKRLIARYKYKNLVTTFEENIPDDPHGGPLWYDVPFAYHTPTR